MTSSPDRERNDVSAAPVDRRRFLQTSAGAAALLATTPLGPAAAQGRRAAAVDSALATGIGGGAGSGPQGPLRIDEFNMVGVFDADWLLEPRFTRLLDNMAASPKAFEAVRFFGALNSGERENVFPTTSGIVWPALDRPMDFSVTLDALDALTSRGMTPFISLTFFPAAVSTSPIEPPATFDAWQRLVRSFLDRLVHRFGGASIRDWWFEVWNEPNMPPFWRGSFEQYLDLYRATSEAVLESGHPIRLGGPAIAYLPGSGAALIDRFLEFVAREPTVKCDFVSLHRKGIWTSEETEPRIEKLVDAADATARAVLRYVPDRARGLSIVNNEADMKVQFDRPYEPRMAEQFPAWLTALMIAYDTLSARYGAQGLRFLAASDNANQQLIRSPFDGRRSIMTRVSASPRDLVKLPVYHFYELLRLLGDRHGTFLAGGDTYFPNSDLVHLISASDRHVASLFACYPTEGSPGDPRAWSVDYTLQDIPWPRVNVARFRIDATHSNAYTAAGRTLSGAIPDVDAARRIRQAQELGTDTPLRSGLSLADSTFRDAFELGPFAIVLHWITPFSDEPPAAPRWLEAGVEDGNVVLRWTPNREPFFYSYEVYRLEGERPVARLSPVPLRAAMWVDTAPSGGSRIYGVRAVSASGILSAMVASPRVTV